MAHIHRLIFLVLLACSAWLPTSSFASFPAKVEAPPAIGPMYSGPYVAFTTDAAAAYYGAFPSSAHTYTGIRSTTGLNDYLQGTKISTGQLFEYLAPIGWKCPGQTYATNVRLPMTCPAVPKCPAKSTLTGSTCTCTAPSIQFGTDSNSTCGADPDVAKCAAVSGGADLYTSSAYRPVGGSYCPSDGAGSKCAASVTGGYATVKDGVKSWITEITYDGNTCAPPAAGTGTGTDAPTPCKGQQGTVNGVSVCIPFGPSNPPAQAVTSSTKTNPDGSTTTTTTDTSCNGTNCTTTTTTTGTAAPVGGTPGAPTTPTTTKDTKPQATFCQDNPSSPMCKAGSYSAGACGSVPSCDGDAIQCGIAAAAFKTACALDTSATVPEVGVYDAAKSLTGDQTAILAGNTSLTFSGSSFDQTAHFSSSGLSDLSVTVMGRPVTIQMSMLNQWLGYLGNLAVAITLIVAMRISLGGNLNA